MSSPTLIRKNVRFVCTACKTDFVKTVWLNHINRTNLPVEQQVPQIFEDEQEKMVWAVDKDSIGCPLCNKNETVVMIIRKKPKKTYVLIPRKHQSAPSSKGYDSHPLDGGIPFGEVPGDDDYRWLAEGGEVGPLP
ncbi:hypothetical protein M0R04_05920 [Candidatus Dojkabacteria bacterium]|jgi:hypothetical protein|nr:hypothetical protein [Candidatus Dojkabacteria bacterium]